MKFLHTADWHLGKSLEGYSRLPEQEEFAKDFVKICEGKKPDIIMISGDIFDNPNPPAKAQSIFYDCIKKATEVSEGLMFIIPGNHDSALRLSAAKNLASECGIAIMEDYCDMTEPGPLGKGQILSSAQGVVRVRLRGQEANIAMVPFMSETALGISLYDIDFDDETNASNYQIKLKQIFDKRAEFFDEKAYNFLMAHLFTAKSELSGDEKVSMLGASYMIGSEIFPENADYIALGHIHKMQKVSGVNGRAYYSGSPIHYNKTELKTPEKYLIYGELDEKKNLSIEKIPLPVYKKIEIWEVDDYKQALRLAEQNQDENSWVYIDIKNSELLTSEDISKLKSLKPDIIDIKIGAAQQQLEFEQENLKEMSETEKFTEFYKQQTGQEPEEEISKKFLYFLDKAFEDEEN